MNDIVEAAMNNPASALTPHDVTIQQIEEIERASEQVINRLRESTFAPDHQKQLHLRFSLTQAARLVGRTPQAIRLAEKEGRLPAPHTNERGRRAGYTVAELNAMRQLFGTLPHRADTDEPVILAVQNFKGGVGKSTVATHLAHYLALQGYRICVLDCDPQATATSLFGLNPDFDVNEDQSLAPFLTNEEPDLTYALRPTYWENIDLIPANLSLYNIEYYLAGQVAGNAQLLERLSFGITSIAGNYDVIIIDPPPALGMIALSVLRAANALVVPVRPATIDFSSTRNFFTMMIEALTVMAGQGVHTSYKFLKVLANDVDEQKSMHRSITGMMHRVYGTHMLSAVMKDSAEIDNAGGRLMTVYELASPITSKQTHDRCRGYLDAVNREIETEIRKTWPSHAQKLRDEFLV